MNYEQLLFVYNNCIDKTGKYTKEILQKTLK